MGAKKGISASLFILFLCYTIMVMVRSCKKGTGVGPKLHRIVNEMAYSHLFFFLASILSHILTPKEFPTVLIYFYLILLVVEIVASMLENQMLNKLSFWLQTGVLSVLYVVILSDDW